MYTVPMLALVLSLFGFSLPLDHWRAQPSPPPTPRRLLKQAVRRAPLAEHGWEAHVLFNLTKSE